MKISDVNEFKGQIKTAIQKWGNGKIDELFPGKASVRVLAKNGLNNVLNMYDHEINRYIDGAFLFISQDGIIDSDVMIDALLEMFEEMKPVEYRIGGFMLSAGKGELVVNLPDHFIMNMIMGNLERVKFTTEDFKELKTYLN